MATSLLSFNRCCGWLQPWPVCHSGIRSTLRGTLPCCTDADGSSAYRAGNAQPRRLKHRSATSRGVSVGDRWRCNTSFVPAAVSFGEARELIMQGQVKFRNGDRMGALKLFEESLEKGPSREERQAALFNATAVHASFGDVELAQITLREGINSGLVFDAAMRDKENPLLVPMQVSPQISIQLRKFAEACKRVKAAVQPDRSAVQGRGGLGLDGGLPVASLASARGLLGTDISDRLKTEVSGIDGSIGGIIRRVLVLLVVGVALGVTLFYVGLQYAFPEL
eukprot:jgi/Botrbrau1/13448/Bobra.0082s0052.1